MLLGRSRKTRDLGHAANVGYRGVEGSGAHLTDDEAVAKDGAPGGGLPGSFVLVWTPRSQKRDLGHQLL